jgi:hypothetical protein
MAKKRKRQEEKKEEREYKPPEFDRLDYIKTEVGISKATMIAAVFSIPMALAAMFIVPVGGVAAGFMAGITGIAFVYILLPLVKIDIKPFKITHWAGIMSTYFLVFLAVWVVLCNPPFNDYASPDIRSVKVSCDGGTTWANVTSISGSYSVKVPTNVTTLIIRAQVTDNVEVNVNTVMISKGASTILMTQPSTSNPILFESSSSVALFDVFTITASDTNGNSASYKFDIMPITG